jgi:hypothetical protein
MIVVEEKDAEADDGDLRVQVQAAGDREPPEPRVLEGLRDGPRLERVNALASAKNERPASGLRGFKTVFTLRLGIRG